MKLPLYELTINEEQEAIVNAVALVKHPAIEKNFLAFNSDEKHLKFSSDDERKELLGAVMIPDMPIYRKSPDGFEYQVFASADTIRNVAQVYFKKGFQGNLNLDHTDTSAQSYIFQSMIVDRKNGIAPLDLPDGSLVFGAKVESEEIWNNIKAGKWMGFSVEGVFNLLETKFSSQSTEEVLVSKINELTNFFKNNNI